jgi:hypothetical protein
MPSAQLIFKDLFSIDFMVLFNSNQVLTKLYDELKNIGETRREIKKENFALASDTDWHRTDTCWYNYNGVINRKDGKHYVFTHGTTGYTWRHLAKVDEAVMYAKIGWCKLLENYKDIAWHPLRDLPEEESIDELGDEQISSILDNTLDERFLIGSWEKQLFIRDGRDYNTMSYVKKPIPEELIRGEKISKSRMANLRGIHIVLETEMSAEEIRAKGLEPTGHQEFFYKEKTVQFLFNNVKDFLAEN